MSDEQMAASTAAAAGGAPPRFGGTPWPHASQHSLDSQVSRMQLAQAALEKADMFKVSLNNAHLQAHVLLADIDVVDRQRPTGSAWPQTSACPTAQQECEYYKRWQGFQASCI